MTEIQSPLHAAEMRRRYWEQQCDAALADNDTGFAIVALRLAVEYEAVIDLVQGKSRLQLRPGH